MPMSEGERHYVHRTGWLRAAVLGANDGILSTASLVLGVAASHATQQNVLIAILGGLAARAGGAAVGAGIARVTFWGALAMALTTAVGALFGAVV